MDKYVGKRLDKRYEIKEIIGEGGMAVVYKAYDLIEDSIVAIKILKEEYLNNKDFIRRFRNESKAIAVLSHKNIVKVYDVSLGDVLQYIVMEYIEGITLKEYINTQKKISWQDAVHFTTQILMALEHAHNKGIIHRDIKPQNIMLLQDGTIKVTDFGIARFARGSTHTITDEAIGSVHYISPEQAKGEVTSEKADIYSVGVMLYEMITGKLPFEADNAVSVAIMQMQADPKKPREINPEIPEGLEDITLKAMQKDAVNRYSSAVSMLDAIEEFKKNPSIRFEYRYLTNDSPTKYVEAIKGKKDLYGDSYNSRADIKGDFLKSSSKPKNIKRVIWIGLAVLSFAIIFAIYAITGAFGPNYKDVDVPNFIGQKLSIVQSDRNYNFVWVIERVYDPNQPEGVIVDQEPRAGSKKVKENANIVLKVNTSGTLVSIPNIKGQTEEAAIKKITEAGLKYEVHYVENNETAKGIVKGSTPEQGTQVVAGSTTVLLYVSKGPADATVDMPNVANKTIDKAKNEIISKGLMVNDQSIVYQKSSQPKDTVIMTDPLPGVKVKEGTVVTLTVSSGPPEEKTVEVSVDLPVNVRREINMTVLVNNIVNSEHTKKIIPAHMRNGIYTMRLSGTGGKVSVLVRLEGRKYREYEVNYDTGICTNKYTAEFEE